MPEISTATVAAELGMTPAGVSKIFKREGIGRLVTPRMRLLTRADVERIRRVRKDNPVGNPDWRK